MVGEIMPELMSQLVDPEEGWKRVSCADSNIIYTGTWKTQNLSIYYNSTSKYSNEKIGGGHLRPSLLI